MRRLANCLTAALLLGGCLSNRPECHEAEAPRAAAGEDRTLSPGRVLLEATGVEEGLRAHWELTGAPQGSRAVLDAPGAPSSTFVADVAGRYAAVLHVVDGCGRRASDEVLLTVPAGAPNQRPQASVRAERTELQVGQRVSLDAHASVDPEGSVLRWTWRVVTQPAPAAEVLAPEGAQAWLSPTAAGLYVVEVVADDGVLESEPARLELRAGVADSAVVARAGEDRVVRVGELALLDGSESVVPQTARVEWRLALRPETSSATVQDAHQLRAGLVPDVPGDYLVALRLVGLHSVEEDLLLLQATASGHVEQPEGVSVLPHAFVGAEHSTTLGRLVAISRSPDLLHVLEPETGSLESLALPAPPLALELSADGREALVTHAASVSQVGLAPLELLSHWPGPVELSDAIPGTGGLAYLLPAGDGEEAAFIHVLDLAEGAVTRTDASLPSGATGRLHPSGARLYLQRPNDGARLYVFSVSGSQLLAHPDLHPYYSCGEFWFAQDAGRLLTLCGAVLELGDVAERPFLQLASLRESGTVLGMADSPARGAHATLWYRADEGTSVRVYDATSLEPRSRLPLPRFLTMTNAFPVKGRFVFASPDGGAWYVLGTVAEEAIPAPHTLLIRLSDGEPG